MASGNEKRGKSLVFRAVRIKGLFINQIAKFWPEFVHLFPMETELRVGNYVNYFSENADRWVNSHQLSANDLSCILQRVDQAEPILITDQWLEAFGFSKRMNHYEKGHGLWISLQYLGDPTETSIWIHGQYCPAVKIKFVHQIQNLFFALTGQELIVPSFNLNR